MLAQEDSFEAVATITRQGRAIHAAWVERVFAGELARRRGRARQIRRAQLVAICDVYMWKLLRRDLGLARAAMRDEVARAATELEAIVGKKRG